MVDTTGNGREAWWSHSRPRRTMGMSCKRRVWSYRRQIIGKRLIVSSSLHLFSEFIILKSNWSLSSSSCEHQRPLWSNAFFSLWPTSSWNSEDHKVHPLLRSLFLKPSVSGMDMSWPCLCNYKCPWTSGQAWYSWHTRRKKKKTHGDRWCWLTYLNSCFSAMAPKLNDESPWEIAVNTGASVRYFIFPGETQTYSTFVRHCANY